MRLLGRRTRAVPAAIRSACGHADARPRVVDVALRVPQRGLVLGLRGRRGVPRAHDDLVLARRELDGGAPLAPRPRAEVVEQLRLRPACLAVERDVDARDVALAARERVAAELQRTGGDGCAI